MLVLQLLHEVEDLRLDRHVERGGGLVGQEQARVHRQRAGQADALALAAGEGVRVAAHVPGVEPDVLQQLAHPLAEPLAVGDAEVAQRLTDDVDDREARVQRLERILEQHPHLLAQQVELLPVHVRDLQDGAVARVEPHLAAGRIDRAHDAARRGGLAAAALAHQADRLPLADLEADAVDGLDPPHVPAEEPLADREVGAQVVDGEDRGARGAAPHGDSLAGSPVPVLPFGCAGRLCAGAPVAAGGGARCRRLVGHARVRLRTQLDLLRVQEAASVMVFLQLHQSRHVAVAHPFDEVVAAVAEGAAGGPRVRIGDGAADAGQGAPLVLGAGQRSDQRLRVGMPGVLEQAGDGGALDHPPQVHDHHLLGDLGDDRQVVRDEQHRHVVALLDVSHQLQHLRLDGHVDGGRGLVGDQQAGMVDERHGDHHPLPHAAREVEDVGVQAGLGARDADVAQHLDGDLVRLVLGHLRVVDQDRLAELVADGMQQAQRRHRLLVDVGDLVAADLPQPLRLGQVIGQDLRLGAIVAVQDDLPALDLARPRLNLQDRLRQDALAAAALPHQADGLALVDRQGHPVHGAHHARLGAEVGAEVLDVEEGLSHRSCSGRCAARRATRRTLPSGPRS